VYDLKSSPCVRMGQTYDTCPYEQCRVTYGRINMGMKVSTSVVNVDLL
jgi:hypothetical protein